MSGATPPGDVRTGAREMREHGSDRDVRESRGSALIAERAYIESLLEGVPLPATPEDLAQWTRRNGEPRVARRLKSLPSRRFDSIDEVGEALEPVQPGRLAQKHVPRVESGLPPGGPAYGLAPNPEPAA